MDTQRKMLNAHEVSEVFFQGKIKIGKVYEMARTGELPCVKIGKRKLLFCLQDLHEWWDKASQPQQEASGSNIRKLY